MPDHEALPSDFAASLNSGLSTKGSSRGRHFSRSVGHKDNARPRWKQLYEAAILEPDAEKLAQRIDEAYKAIIDEYVMRPLTTHPELFKAVHYLRLLRNSCHAGRVSRVDTQISLSIPSGPERR